MIVDKIYEIIREINSLRGRRSCWMSRTRNYALDVSARGYVLETGKVVLSNDGSRCATTPR